jgi:probable LLM family oxidoreductase
VTSDLDALGTRDRPTLGLDTFGDVPLSGEHDHAEVIRQVVAEGVLADRLGIDYLGLGEHHREDYAITAPDVVLAAIAGQTERIRLGTGVTVLSSDDPVRVYERFATLDAVAPGRAEVQLGRGSFIESFRLFGYSLDDYDRLFAEKLDLFAALQGEGRVSWEGTVRAPLEDAEVWPKTAAGRLPAWIAVGGTPESVVRAARYGLPLVLAVIGGSPRGFVPLADLYRRALTELGHDELPIGMHSPGHVAATDEQAREELFPHQAELFTRIGRERGWPPYSRIAFEQAASPEGAMFVGSPETVARKIAWAVRLLGLSRFQLKYAVGALPPQARRESIRLYGEEVIPRVRELLASSVGAEPA